MTRAAWHSGRRLPCRDAVAGKGVPDRDGRHWPDPRPFEEAPSGNGASARRARQLRGAQAPSVPARGRPSHPLSNSPSRSAAMLGIVPRRDKRIPHEELFSLWKIFILATRSKRPRRAAQRDLARLRVASVVPVASLLALPVIPCTQLGLVPDRPGAGIPPFGIGEIPASPPRTAPAPEPASGVPVQPDPAAAAAVVRLPGHGRGVMRSHPVPEAGRSPGGGSSARGTP